MDANAVHASYDELQQLGAGMYGEAFLLKDCSSGRKLVVKHVPLDRLDEEKHVVAAMTEVSALEALCHPNVVRCHGSWVMRGADDAMQRPWSEGTEDERLPITEALAAWKTSQNDTINPTFPSLNILTEWVDGGSLDKLILSNKDVKPFEEDLVGIWLAQMTLAMDHMHSSHVIHRDIKPANIFITKSGLIKVGDLGCCKLVQQVGELCSNEYGSPQYLSPEVWQHGVHTHKSDMWSIGCVIYELLACEPPFHQPGLMHGILNLDPRPLPEHYSAPLRALVLRLLQKDPSQRPSSAELLRDPVVAHHAKRWHVASCTPLE